MAFVPSYERDVKSSGNFEYNISRNPFPSDILLTDRNLQNSGLDNEIVWVFSHHWNIGIGKECITFSKSFLSLSELDMMSLIDI